MSDIILDGTGQGFTAKVDSLNRLHTHSLGVTMIQSAALNGDSFNISSGLIELTDDADSAIYYLKNNTHDDLFIYSQSLLIGTSTGSGLDIATVTFSTDITGGTIVTDEVDSVAVNSKIGASNQLEVDSFSGGQGKTG